MPGGQEESIGVLASGQRVLGKLGLGQAGFAIVWGPTVRGPNCPDSVTEEKDLSCRILGFRFLEVVECCPVVLDNESR